MVDFVTPLNKGNFIIFKGQIDLGKRYLLNSTVTNFLYNNKAMNDNINKVVYVTYSKKNADTLKMNLENDSKY